VATILPADERRETPLPLDAIQQVLERTIAAAVEREQALASAPTEAAGAGGGAWLRLLEPLEARLRAFQECADWAGQEAAEADAALAAGAEALRRWLDAAGANRQRLAGGAGREV
jgi:hypothetical protein